jgi:hypothetical protein
MSNIFEEWQEMNAEQTIEKLTPDQSLTTAHQITYLDQEPARDPTVISIVNPNNSSGIGAITKGFVVTTIAAIAALGTYLYIDRNTEDSMRLESDIADDYPQSQVRPLYELSSSLGSTDQASIDQIEVRETGCQRQLSSVDGVAGAYTRNGSNTDLCWELGETVTAAGKTRGVVTLWGESPYAGKLDDEIIHDKISSNDISPDELVAFFSSFVLDSVTETYLVVVDRSGENYIWDVDGRLENVVVKLERGEG